MGSIIMKFTNGDTLQAPWWCFDWAAFVKGGPGREDAIQRFKEGLPPRCRGKELTFDWYSRSVSFK